MTTALPEVRESEAQDEVAEIYQQLRTGLGLPMVNLIYRHFATIPGGLQFVWSRLKTPLLDGSLDRARERLDADPEIAGEITFDPAILGASASPPEQAEILTITRFYNRGNVTNLIGLTAVRMLLDGAATGIEGSLPAVEPRAIGEAPVFRPLPRFDDLSAETAGLVNSLANHHSGASAGVTPSLYLHLSYWPRFLAALGSALDPVFASGAFMRGRDTTRRLAAREAAGLLPAMIGPPPSSDVVAGLNPSLRLFTGSVIPEMVPVGLAIVRAIEPGEHSTGPR